MILQYILDMNTMGIMASILGVSGAGMAWIGKRFDSVQVAINNKIDAFRSSFETKLDYHEKHDDDRFQSLTNDLWTLKVRNAARDKQYLDQEEIVRVN